MHAADTAFQSVLDSLADPVIVAGEDGRVVYANRATGDLLGWVPAELVGKPVVTLIPERFQSAHLSAFERYFRTGEPRLLGHPIHVPVLHRDGREVDIELGLSTQAHGDGDRPALVTAVLRDLSHRIELERQLAVTRYLRATTDASALMSSLTAAEDVLRTVVNVLVVDFEAVLARVWLYDAAQGVLYPGAAAGVPDSLHGTSTRIDPMTFPYPLGEVARTREAFVRNGLGDADHVDMKWARENGVAGVAALPLVHGETLYGVLVYFPRRAIEPEVLEALRAFAAIVTGSLHLVWLLEREQEARAEAEGAVRARDTLLSSVSHDLKSPLTVIRTQSDLLQRRLRAGTDIPPDRVLAGLETISSTAVRMTAQINELVDAARGRPRGAHEDVVDMADLARRVTVELAGPRGEVTTTSEPVQVWGSPVRLERVIANLVDNAVKYGSPDSAVRVSVETEGGSAVLRVADDGVGIPQDELPRIWEQFYRASNVGNQVGSGLGLANVREIVEQHGGQVDVASVVGEGSTFTVWLPLHAAPSGV